MSTEILMPALSPTMAEGKLAKWHVTEGDEVRAGDVIAEIETDKATIEVEAVDDGRLGKILVPEGTDHVPVNRPIALLMQDGEDEAGAAADAESDEAAKMAKIAEMIKMVPFQAGAGNSGPGDVDLGERPPDV